MSSAIQSLVLAAAGNGGPTNPNSRYYGAVVESLVLPNGTMVQYLQRRIIPSASIYKSLQNYTVADGDRIDNLAAKYLGDPTLYWLICDSNTSMDPDELDFAARLHDSDTSRLRHSGGSAQWLVRSISPSSSAPWSRCRRQSR